MPARLGGKPVRIDGDELNELTALIYGAALDPSKWTVFLDRLHAVTGGVIPFLMGHDLETGSHLGLQAPKFDPSFIDSYERYYGALNVWAEGWMQGEVGTPMQAEAMCRRDRLEKTEFYHDWVLPQEDIVGGGGVMLIREETRMFALGGNIRRKDVERLENDWVRLIRLLTPHLQQAFEISRTLAGRSIEIAALSGAAASGRDAIFVINTTRRIVYANTIAEHLLQDGSVVLTDYRRAFWFGDPDADARLTSVLQQASLPGFRAPVAMRLPNGKRELGLACRFVPFDADSLNYPPFGILVSRQEPCVMLAISPERRQDDLATVLRARFGLTLRESEVALQIANGLAPRDIAELRNASVHTVRNQLKSLMSKIGARRQADVMRTVAAIRLEDG